MLTPSLHEITRGVLLSSILFISACRTSPAPATETPDETPYTVRNKITTIVPPEVRSHNQHHSNPLTAHAWQLKQATNSNGQRIDALFVDENRPLTLEFAPTSVRIRNTCNAMNGTYSLDTANNTLTINPLIGTMMACPQPLMALDAAITQRLENPLHLSIERTGDATELHLKNTTGDTLVFGK